MTNDEREFVEKLISVMASDLLKKDRASIFGTVFSELQIDEMDLDLQSFLGIDEVLDTTVNDLYPGLFDFEDDVDDDKEIVNSEIDFGMSVFGDEDSEEDYFEDDDDAEDDDDDFS